MRTILKKITVVLEKIVNFIKNLLSGPPEPLTEEQKQKESHNKRLEAARRSRHRLRYFFQDRWNKVKPLITGLAGVTYALGGGMVPLGFLPLVVTGGFLALSGLLLWKAIQPDQPKDSWLKKTLKKVLRYPLALMVSFALYAVLLQGLALAGVALTLMPVIAVAVVAFSALLMLSGNRFQKLTTGSPHSERIKKILRSNTLLLTLGVVLGCLMLPGTTLAAMGAGFIPAVIGITLAMAGIRKLLKSPSKNRNRLGKALAATAALAAIIAFPAILPIAATIGFPGLAILLIPFLMLSMKTASKKIDEKPLEPGAGAKGEGPEADTDKGLAPDADLVPDPGLAPDLNIDPNANLDAAAKEAAQQAAAEWAARQPPESNLPQSLKISNEELMQYKMLSTKLDAHKALDPSDKQDFLNLTMKLTAARQRVADLQDMDDKNQLTNKTELKDYQELPEFYNLFSELPTPRPGAELDPQGQDQGHAQVQNLTPSDLHNAEQTFALADRVQQELPTHLQKAGQSTLTANPLHPRSAQTHEHAARQSTAPIPRPPIKPPPPPDE
jgi:hypothetical protein